MIAAGNAGAPAVGAERFRFLDRPCRPDWEIGEGDGLAGVQGQDGFAVVKPNALQLVRGIFAGDCIVEIQFDRVGVKKTMANYAPLKKLTEE